MQGGFAWIGRIRCVRLIPLACGNPFREGTVYEPFASEGHNQGHRVASAGIAVRTGLQIFARLKSGGSELLSTQVQNL